ncbi:MAG TPA: M67 family metallopeptidase [Thermoanaerobaculia bacterium]|nr:M67 family metallopeptidase [Thermoanaerobaculia bacterium]
MRLELAAADLEAIRRHAEHSYPEECCGFLLGHGSGGGGADSAALSSGGDAASAAFLSGDAASAAFLSGDAASAASSSGDAASAASLEEETKVERVVPAVNERQDSRHNRFVISPATVLAAHKEARAAGLEVVGYYHSHPDHPAEPSEFDREHAWPGLSYLIVSVREGRLDTARSWRLRDDRERFDEEPLAGGPTSPKKEAD